MHQLSDDARIFADSLDDDGQDGSEEYRKHFCRCLYFTSNQFEQTRFSGRTRIAHLFVEYLNDGFYLCGGTSMRVSTCHGRGRSTVSYALWRSMNHIKRSTLAFHPISCRLFFFLNSLIADGPHHYHRACGHKGSSHLSPTAQYKHHIHGRLIRSKPVLPLR